MDQPTKNQSIRKNGSEHFHRNGAVLPEQVIGFWQWCQSDLIANTTRGRLAEYLVALDLKVAGGVRVEWDAYDLVTRDGITIEVKSAAYLQSWAQPRPSAISFDIRPTLGWSAATNEYSTERRRQAQVYVFALLAHLDRATLDPLDVQQWRFYILSTESLNTYSANGKRISLGALLRLEPTPAHFGKIGTAVAQVV